MGDPVVSGTSVFAVTGGCFVQAVNAATGQSRWTTPANNYYCDPSVFDTMIQDPVQESSPPFVDGDRLLLGQFVVDPDLQPPSFPFPVYFQEAVDTATGATVADSAPGTMPADIRGRVGLGSSPYVSIGNFQGIPLFGGAWANGIATVGSLDSKDDHLTIKLMLGSGVSKLPLLGPSWVVSAGTGVATTGHGDPTIGPAVRIYGSGGPGRGQHRSLRAGGHAGHLPPVHRPAARRRGHQPDRVPGLHDRVRGGGRRQRARH